MPETVGQSWQQAFPAEAVHARAARAWVSTHTGHEDAQLIAGELFVAVLAARPGKVQMTVSTAGPRSRITASGDSRLPRHGIHGLHGDGRSIIAALAAIQGVSPDGCGLWAELPWDRP